MIPILGNSPIVTPGAKIFTCSLFYVLICTQSGGMAITMELFLYSLLSVCNTFASSQHPSQNNHLKEDYLRWLSQA